METNNKEPNLDNWSDFAGDYIKAEYLGEFPAKLVCIGVHGLVDNGKNKILADIEYNNRTWKFDLNKTNQNFIKSKGLMPRQIIGKILVVDKIKARNPTTNSMVDSLIIVDIVE